MNHNITDILNPATADIIARPADMTEILDHTTAEFFPPPTDMNARCNHSLRRSTPYQCARRLL